MQLTGSPPHASPEHRGFVPSDFLLHKLDEVNKSVEVNTRSIADCCFKYLAYISLNIVQVLKVFF